MRISTTRPPRRSTEPMTDSTASEAMPLPLLHLARTRPKSVISHIERHQLGRLGTTRYRSVGYDCGLAGCLPLHYSAQTASVHRQLLENHETS